MAASKLAFLDQPISTTSGFTIQAAGQDSVNLRENHGLRVAVQDSTGAIVTTDTSSVTIAIGSGTGTLSGTLTQAAANGIATFNDLAIAGSGAFTLTASDGALTTATTNSFSQTAVNRINPAVLTGSISTAGVANAIGPYRFRGGSEMYGVVIELNSVTAADAAAMLITPPGVALSATTGASVATFAAMPSYRVVQLANDCDVYVNGTTVTTAMSVFIESAQSAARV